MSNRDEPQENSDGSQHSTKESESDLNRPVTPGEELAPKKASAQILRHELQEALDALGRTNGRLLFSSISAGLELGFSVLLMARIHTLVDGSLPKSLVELLVANMYAFGFVLVIVGRSELFTEQTSLAVLPVLNGRASFGSLLRLWGVVYVGNLIGAAVVAGFIVFIGRELQIVHPPVFHTIASGLTRHSALAIVCSGILAGWLMGLLSWLVAAERDTISQIVTVWLITTAIGLLHLHHVVAGSVETLAGIYSSPDLGWSDFGHFAVWATLGNAIGGPFFVALLKYAIAHDQRDDDAAMHSSR